MSWVDIVWPLLGAVGLTLGMIHLLIGVQQRQLTAHLMFALTAISVSAVAVFELLAMRAQTPEAYALLLRWAHVPLASTIVGIVAFVRLHLQVGRPWLAWLVCASRVACLLPDFLTGVNLNFAEITGLRRISIWGGDSVVAPIGVPNPWMILGQVSSFLLIAFLVDATVTGRRRGSAKQRRSVLLICGSMALFMIFSPLWALAVVTGVLQAPLIVNPAFVGVLVVMSYELGGDVLRAAQLAQSLSVSERQLRDSEQRMELAVNAAGIGLWNWDIASGNFWMSEQALHLLGFASGETVDRERFLERVHPDDREGLRLAFDGAAHGSGDYRSEYRVQGPHEGVRWIVARGQVDFAEDRAPLMLRGVFVDITDRKEAEERFRLVVETSPTAMLMVADGGAITLVNRQAEVVFGYSRTELVGMNVDALVPLRYRTSHGTDRAAYAGAPTARAMGVGRELFARRKDGSELPVEIALSPIHSERGLFVVASIADISERKRADRELAVQRDELAHLSRVILLAELSGSLAHELNQPLTAILSNAQAALRFLAHAPPNLDEVHESLTNIVENDKRAGEVIRGLRGMLRKERAEFRRLEINDVVLDVLRIIRSDLVNRNVEVVLDLAANLPAINGDRVQLQQVLLNLIMNGTDAMDEIANDCILTLRTQWVANEGVHVSISDVGRGIPADDVERIFSPFVTSKSSGMGLGLAVCRSIVQAHRGTIWATNNVTRGATVHFRIPARPDTLARAD